MHQLADASGQKSTNVRAPQLPPTALRRAVSLASRLAPGPTAAWAVRRWMAVPPPRADRARGSDGGELARVDLGHTDIAVETWGEGPPVYLLHGWHGWRGQLGPLVAPLVAAGHRAVALDAPGHGDSGPSRYGRGRSSAVDFIDAVNAVTEYAGEPAAIVGHSLGGTAAALAVLGGQSSGKLIMIGASAQPLAMVDAFADVFELSTTARAGMITGLERLVGRSMTEFDLLQRRSMPVPTLLIHDRHDKEVAFADGELLAAVWPAATFLPTTGLGHRRILRDPDVVRTVVDFIAR